MRTVAIMQPYFLPYIGYFQLISAADVFVVYDNIKYTKKGWINRNRMLLNGCDVTFTLPLRKDSDSLDVVLRELAADFERDKLLNRFREAYRHAPYFSQTFPLLERIMNFKERNLFDYILNSIIEMCAHLCIRCEIRASSAIAIDHQVKAQDKVLALCKALSADRYVNAIGGMEMYSKEEFSTVGIALNFIKSHACEYKQFGKEFVPGLSIVDVLMFNPPSRVREWVSTNYELV